MPTRAECPAFLLPVPHLRPGDETECPLCGQRVVLREPPANGPVDRWGVLADARIDCHWVEATLEGEPAC
jgi:hypothetical protein